MVRDLANAGVALLKPIARKGISAGLDAGKDFIQDKAENMLGLKEKKKGKGFFGKLIRRGAHGAVDVLGDTVGLGAKPANFRPRTTVQKPVIGVIPTHMEGGHAGAKKGRGFLSSWHVAQLMASSMSSAILSAAVFDRTRWPTRMRDSTPLSSKKK